MCVCVCMRAYVCESNAGGGVRFRRGGRGRDASRCKRTAWACVSAHAQGVGAGMGLRTPVDEARAVLHALLVFRVCRVVRFQLLDAQRPKHAPARVEACQNGHHLRSGP